MDRRALRCIAGIALLALAGSATAEEARVAPRIVNGVLTHAHPSTGALLLGGSPDSATLLCSGTMIGCDTFMTAAHCVCDFTGADCQPGGFAPPIPSDYVVFLQHAGFHSVTSVAVESSYSFPDNDIAILKLTTPVDGVAPSPLPSQKPGSGTIGTLVGFGRDGGVAQDFGLKRQGTVSIAPCTPPISDTLSICWNFTAPVGPVGSDSNTCNGDSGGPLFVSEGPDLVVAGVTSGGTSLDCLEPDASYDTNVHNYLSFIQNRGGPDILNTTCGGLSQVGDSDTTVNSFSGIVDGVTPSSLHSFPVPAGAEMLRVAMNADEGAVNDFDLYVRFGAAPTLAEFDCRAFGANNWGFCEFPTPAQGTWHVMVNAFSGSGTFQATATVFGEAPPPPPPLPEGAQTELQRKCLDVMQKGGQKVAKAQTKDAGGCLKAFASGRVDQLGNPGQTQTAQACVTNDVKARVVKAEAKTLKKDTKKCLALPEQLPDYAYVGGAPVNTGGQASSETLVADVFGVDLDAALVTQLGDADGAKCQAELQKRVAKVFDTAWKAAHKGMKKSLAGTGGFAIVTSDAELVAALDATLQGDPKGKIAKARAKLLQGAAKRCVTPLTSLSALAPGLCVNADVNQLADCAGRQAVCRACGAVEAATGLDLDCDLADDALTNVSCP